MKIFHFFSKTKKPPLDECRREKLFLHLTSNIVIVLVVTSVFFMSLLSPLSVETATLTQNAIYRGNANKNNISLMINVYWGTEFLGDILQTLKDENVSVTFFVGGSWVAKNEEMLFEMCFAGHEIASHGYNHKDHAKLSREAQEKEIVMAEKMILSATGKKPTLFAPPSGSYNKTTIEVANNLGYQVIMWSKDTIDWRDHDTKKIFDRATTNLQNGDLILMHPTKNTLEALGDIIKSIKSQGFELSTVSDNLA